MPAKGLASTYRCSISQRNIELSTDSVYALERVDRPPANGLHSAEVRGDAGPTQRARGVGCRKKARYATASSVASEDSATPRSTMAHRISRSASLR